MDIDDSYQTYYSGPLSDHFDGERFFNPWAPRPKKSFMDMLKWRMNGERASWPESVENPPRPRLEETPDERGRVTYIGHASVLIQMNGVNMLVDPVFSERACPFSQIGPKRVRPPFAPLVDLPQIDVVFVSHNHYDHLDLASLSWLASHHKPLFITPLGNSRIFKHCVEGCQIKTVDWYEATLLPKALELIPVPCQHWSRRSLNDTNRDLWAGFYLKSKTHSVYYVADSGFHEGLFQDIGQRYGAPDVCLVPIGAYAPR